MSEGQDMTNVEMLFAEQLHQLVGEVRLLKLQVHRLTELAQESESCEADDLRDILHSFPGGYAALAKASGYHRETLYSFANAKRTKRFPFKRAAQIAKAFGHRRALGKRVTINRLRSSWRQRLQKDSEEGDQ